MIDSLVKCDRTMEHGESERERKQNRQVNMLLFSVLGKKLTCGCMDALAQLHHISSLITASVEMINTVICDGHIISYH